VRPLSNYLIILMLMTTLTPVSVTPQELYHLTYPAFGIGASAGASYYFPSDLNDYIDLTVPGAIVGIDKEHINAGIDVGLFITVNLSPSIDIVPEFNYLYSRRAFSQVDLDVVVSHFRLGSTIYYVRHISSDIKLRLGTGLAKYFGAVSWEYPFSNSQTWDGHTMGYHAAVGAEMQVSDHVTISFTLLGRYADIETLHDENGNPLRVPGSTEHLHLNFSGIEAKMDMGYYF